MSSPNSDARQAAFRLLPSVDELLRDEAVAQAGANMPHERLVRALGEILDGWRQEIGSGRLDAEGLSASLAAGGAAAALTERLATESRRGVVPVVNATGVVLHTGLGRAPVHPEAAEAMRLARRQKRRGVSAGVALLSRGSRRPASLRWQRWSSCARALRATSSDQNRTWRRLSLRTRTSTLWRRRRQATPRVAVGPLELPPVQSGLRSFWC